MSRTTLIAGVGKYGRREAAGSIAAVAAIALGRTPGHAAGSDDPAAVLVEVAPDRRRAPTVLAGAAAKRLEGELRELDHEAVVAARGRICLVQMEAGEGTACRVADIARSLDPDVSLAIAAPPAIYREIALSLDGRIDLILLATDPEPSPHDCALLEIAEREAGSLASAVESSSGRPGGLAARRALAGAGSSRPSDRPSRGHGLYGRLRTRLVGERAQATPLTLGAVFTLLAGAVVLVAIAGAITGKGKAQRAADLSALSAARSMKDDLPRLLAPATLPNGLPNPAHMPKPVYLARAKLTAVRIATANGASPLTVSVRFPDGLSFAPVSARVSVRIATAGTGPADPVWATARVGAAVSLGSVPAVARGGGYSGPLAERQGYGMRPDVTTAFDRLSGAATAAGVTVVINSAFRSDAQQASLFAANPDPRWVAPPGSSLHRCATELDLGPSSAYGWLATNAGRFGFVKRYSWEPWHFGFSAGPAPCSKAGNRVAGSSDRSQALSASVPDFVPARFRRSILVAAMKWGVSAALLSAQLLAESDFDPAAVSPAGAQGIAQFMPGTAAAYGLRDPFDAERAIDAQARLMKDLLDQFGGRPALALAAYNAGPGAVAPCGCIPDFPETRAYVTRILALLGGAGAVLPVPMEIELVA